MLGEIETAVDSIQGNLASRRVTVCQVLHSLNVGGAEILAWRLGMNLGDRFRFVFACLDELGSLGQDLRSRGFAVEFLGRRPGLDWRCVRKLSRYLRREHVELVHAHQYTPFSYSLLAGLVHRRPPVLFNEHGRFYPDSRNGKRVLFNRVMLRRRDRVVAVGEAVRQALIRNEGFRPERVGVIHNGVALPPALPSLAERLESRRVLGAAAEDFIILQVARLDSIKDHATAVRMMARLVKERLSVRLFIVGDGVERAGIERQVRELAVEAAVQLLGERTDVPQLLRGADAVLLTSLSEGIPVTLIEAMGAGLPVVSTDVGGVREVVEPGVTGLLAPAGADEELARAVSRLFGDRALCGRLALAGRQRAEALFTEDRMHSAYAGLYEEMARVSN